VALAGIVGYESGVQISSNADVNSVWFVLALDEVDVHAERSSEVCASSVRLRVCSAMICGFLSWKDSTGLG